jgi:pimeloyl-ACP methyl ester carboxylesterase
MCWCALEMLHERVLGAIGAITQEPHGRRGGIHPVTTACAGLTIISVKHETRFCRSFDGVGLAYAIDGNGPPVVKASNWMTHLDYERQSPVWRHWVRELSRGRTLIRFDERGCGLSDRQFEGTPTLDTFVGDLAAVVDAAGLERFTLLALSGGGAAAIAYALKNPERVSRLVLYGTWARGRYRRDASEIERARLLGELIRVGWGGTVPAFRQVFSSMYIPSAGEEQKRWYDELQQASSDRHAAGTPHALPGHGLAPDADRDQRRLERDGGERAHDEPQRRLLDLGGDECDPGGESAEGVAQVPFVESRSGGLDGMGGLHGSVQGGLAA